MNKAKRILICEDEEPLLHVMDRAMSSAGYETICARSPREAMERVGRARVDAVVSDINLHGGNAFEVIGDLRRAGRDAPIFLTSGMATQATIAKSRAAGVREVLQKPFEVRVLIERIDAAVNAPRPPNGMRLLVVEDHPDHLRFLAETLREAGFEIRAAATAAEALRIVRREGLDMALVDMLLPDSSGADLVARLTEADPGLHVTILNGEADRDEVRRAFAHGAVRILHKPVAPGELSTVMNGAIAEARRRRSEIEDARRESARPWHHRVLSSAKARIAGSIRRGRHIAPLAVAAAILLSLSSWSSLKSMMAQVDEWKARASRSQDRAEYQHELQNRERELQIRISQEKMELERENFEYVRSAYDRQLRIMERQADAQVGASSLVSGDRRSPQGR